MIVEKIQYIVQINSTFSIGNVLLVLVVTQRFYSLLLAWHWNILVIFNVILFFFKIRHDFYLYRSYLLPHLVVSNEQGFMHIKHHLKPCILAGYQRAKHTMYRVMRPRTPRQETNIGAVLTAPERFCTTYVYYSTAPFSQSDVLLVNKEKCLLVFYSRVQITICVRIADVLSNITNCYVAHVLFLLFPIRFWPDLACCYFRLMLWNSRQWF